MEQQSDKENQPKAVQIVYDSQNDPTGARRHYAAFDRLRQYKKSGKYLKKPETKIEFVDLATPEQSPKKKLSRTETFKEFDDQLAFQNVVASDDLFGSSFDENEDDMGMEKTVFLGTSVDVFRDLSILYSDKNSTEIEKMISNEDEMTTEVQTEVEIAKQVEADTRIVKCGDTDDEEEIQMSHISQESDRMNFLYNTAKEKDDILEGRFDSVGSQFKTWFLTNSRSDILKVLGFYSLKPENKRKRLEVKNEELTRDSLSTCISSQRGSPLIIYYNQLFRPHELTKDGKVTARCTFQIDGVKRCEGYLHIAKDTGEVEFQKLCHHGSQRSHIALSLIIRKLSIMMLTVDTPKEDLFRYATEEAERFDISYLLGTNEAMSRKLDNVLGRHSTDAFPPSLDQTYFTGAKRIFDSSGSFRSENDIMIAWKVDGTDPFFSCDTINLDGKFSEKPNHYRQLYAISTRDSSLSTIIPLVFALCTNSKENTYVDLFHCAKLEGLDPKYIYSEIGIEESRSNPFQRLLKSVFSLAFAPQDKAYLYMKVLKARTVGMHTEIGNFFLYLERQYFGPRAVIEFDVWNCYYRALHGMDFTNNVSESTFARYQVKKKLIGLRCDTIKLQKMFHNNEYAQIKTTIRKTVDLTNGFLRDAKSGRNNLNRSPTAPPLYRNSQFLRAVVYKHPNFDSFSAKIFPFMEIPKMYH
ncbi:hypothetical protein CRE_11706 [Caenorhabditis remanei]|uniref:MULE transposase domain-containing protein n=1 Tax=Caenorhabditis remanei TaxID=31234 RepID=E3M478_CAERE|nr:hypothetical protein CRE_11706 [Caenorhabditis remanei]